MTTPKIKEKKSSKELSKTPNLPWWVELFFVQIGLPESILRSYLKIKNKVQKSTIIIFKNNKLTFTYFIVVVISLAYIKPLIRQASLNNKCIQEASRYLSSNKNKENLTVEISVKAHNICNGGNL